MNEVTSRDQLEGVFGEGTALLFKHSTRCPISARAHGEVETLLGQQPDAPVYKVDVNEQTELSDWVAERTGIDHQSPQVILLRNGQPQWHASRMEIHSADLAEQLGGGGAAA